MGDHPVRGRDVGLQPVDDGQAAATVVVLGRDLVGSVDAGTQAPPQGPECTVTPEGTHSRTQTVRLQLVGVDRAGTTGEPTVHTTS